MGMDFRFQGVWEKFKRLVFPDGPLPTIGSPVRPVSQEGEPTGVGHVIMFIGANDAVAIYPDGRRERGSIDQVWQNAKDSGLATEVSTDEPPPRTMMPCYATDKPTSASAVHYTPDNFGTLCGRRATLLTDKRVTCRKCLTENAKEGSL